MSVSVYLGLGSNLGERERNLEEAIRLLAGRVRVERLSSIYETEPVGYLEQPRFLNAVCEVAASLAPGELLALVKEIESALGRMPGFLNAPRPIDLDILFYGDQVIDIPELTIPHPRLTERAFVLVPLAELAPRLVHPVNGKTVAEMVKRIDVRGVRKWDGEFQVAEKRTGRLRGRP